MQRELRRPFLEQRQAVYLRLGRSLSDIMNHDPGDDEWDPAKEKFFTIYWGEIPLVYDKGVAESLEPFSDKLHSAETSEDKEQLAPLVQAINKACRISLGEDWDIEHPLPLGRE